jgi:hypothetical protein
MPKWLRVLIGLLIAAGAVLVFTMVPKPERETGFPDVPEEPAKLQVTYPGFVMLAEKQDGRWMVVEPVRYPADETTIKEYLGGLRDLQIGERLTRREESHVNYELTTGSATRVRVWGEAGGKSAEWLFGKGAPDRLHVYIRRPDNPDVHLASGVRAYELRKPLAQWRDKRILRLADGDAIARVTHWQDGETYIIEKSSAAWTVNGEPADQAKAAEFAAKLRAFSASDFIDPPAAADRAAYGLDDPNRTLQVTLAAGEEITLEFGDKDESDRVAVSRAGEETLFWVPDWRMSDIPEDPAGLRAAQQD